MLEPHGGKLINRALMGGAKDRTSEAERIPKISLTQELAKEVQNIAHGVFSPLEGFLTRDDYISVMNKGKLANDIAWTLPIVLDIPASTDVKEGGEAALVYDSEPLAIIHIEEIYEYNKEEFAQKVFGTTDPAHPGVAKVLSMEERLAGGKIDLIKEIEFPLSEYYLKPAETRAIFKEKGWETVVGFQTRNVPHVGHEYCQKAALTFVDGLFINPVIGKKKNSDFKDEVIIESYQTLIENYYPEGRAFMSILPLEMRYAGPREAIFHAIVRKNFGCTHFIVGRDHAGVGNYYTPYAAQDIFQEFPDLGITPVFFRSFFYCKKCLGVMNDKTCPHGDEWLVSFSGTEMREKLLRGEKLPEEVMRPEVLDTITKWENPFVA